MRVGPALYRYGIVRAPGSSVRAAGAAETKRKVALLGAANCCRIGAAPRLGA